MLRIHLRATSCTLYSESSVTPPSDGTPPVYDALQVRYPHQATGSTCIDLVATLFIYHNAIARIIISQGKPGREKRMCYNRLILNLERALCIIIDVF
jgi:hypothetical protein